jgi:hypothetical protein
MIAGSLIMRSDTKGVVADPRNFALLEATIVIVL